MIVLAATQRVEPPAPTAAGPSVWTDSEHAPWTDDYLARELATMAGLPDQRFDDGDRHVVQVHKHTQGIMDCYLRRDFLEWGPYPWLQIDGAVWMSLTPQEIESQYMPIKLAQGRVGIGGLGLAYAAMRIASKPDVSEVVVYENNPLVLRLFERNFPNGLPKVTVVEQDVARVENKVFDVFFNDVYQRMLERATFEHWRDLTVQNEIGQYHAWGVEAMLLAFALKRKLHEVPFHLRHVYAPFLHSAIVAVDAGHGVWDEMYVPTLRRARAYARLLGDQVWEA